MGVIKVRAANKTYSYRSGGAVDGATGFTGSVVPFTSLVQSASREYTYKTVSQAAITDTDDQVVPTRVNGTHRFTLFVPAAGYTFKALNGTYVEITEQVLALTAETLVGMVENWSESESDDGNVMESFTIRYGVVGV